MWNKAKCILLASNNKKTSIYQIGNSNFIGYSQEDDRYTGRELYIINDDVIKGGDYCILTTINKIVKVEYNLQADVLVAYKNNHKKIIVTTDKSLVVKYDEKFKDITINNNSLNKSLPQIPQSFIEQYITEYNQGKMIIDVFVEYIDYCNKLICNNALCEHGCIETDIKLKVNPKDNTINIRTVKDSFSREEVKQLLYSFRDEIEDQQCSDARINNFIEQNL